MTDPDLVHHAEQALLGGLIQRPRQIRALDLSADHFADPVHQAIAASLTGEAGETQGFFGRIRGFFSRFSQARRQAEQYMDELPGHCPDPGHIGAYYQMVSAAKAERDAATTQVAEQLAHGAQLLSVAGDRLNRMTGKRDKQSDLPADVARLARTLHGKARNLQDGIQSQPAPAQAQQPAQPVEQNQYPAQAQAESAQQAATAGSADGTPAPGRNAPPSAPVVSDTVAYEQPGSLRREDLENNVLACLMANPHEARRVSGWLPPEVFSEGPRRELYTLIQGFVASRQAIDPITLAWAVQQHAESGRSNHWLNPEFVLGLGEITAVPGTAETLGSPLLADYIYRTTVGEDWAQSGQHGLGTPAERQPLTPASETPEPSQAPAPHTARQNGAAAQQSPEPDHGGPEHQEEVQQSSAGAQPVEPPPVNPAPAGPQHRM